MEAKDTVMMEWGADYDANCGQEICCSILPQYVDSALVEECYLKIQELIYEFVKLELEVQAKISFKAGMEEGKKYKQPVFDFARKQYEAGRREVVEWIEKELILCDPDADDREKWQAKLKEWGIDDNN